MSPRLQRVLASAGLGSRRSCENLIREGRVTIDGRVAGLGSSVDPEFQTILVDGVPIRVEPLEYWVLNKPKGVVSTVKDPQGRRTVVDCVPTAARVFPVGRLDGDTTGVLLLTNDGELAYRLLHPSFGVEKEYEAMVVGRLTEAAAARLARGIELQDGVTAPALVEVTSANSGRSELRLRIHEGKNRQVRRMLEAVGHPVAELHRARFGSLSDDGLAVGEARPLSAEEVATLRGLVQA